jgi:hypothetical protein
MLAHQDYNLDGRFIILMKYDPSAVYTVDYTPTESAKQIDFIKKYTVEQFDTALKRNVSVIKSKKRIEDFKQLANKSQVILGYYPFVDKDQLNQQDETWNPTYLANQFMPFRIRLQLPDGTYVDQKIDQWDTTETFITNRTDYFDQNHNLLEPFNGVNYQYRVEQNIVKFNTALPEGTTVHVEYPYLTGPIRLKIIMRRNLNEVSGLTPFLHEFKAGFQTLI